MVTTSWDWRTRIAIPVFQVARENRKSREEAHVNFVMVAYKRQGRAPFQFLITPGMDYHVAFYRTRGEISYCDRLAELETFAWPGMPVARQEAMCWTRPILRAEFRYLPRCSRSNVPQNLIRHERQSRSQFGYFAPYQNVKIRHIAAAHRQGRVIPAHRSQNWVVAYDQCRLGFIPPGVRAAIRNLDLEVNLGGRANDDEVLSLLDYIDSVDWTQVPLSQSGRGDSPNSDGYGPGLERNTAHVGDFVFFDPRDYREITGEEAGELRSAPRRVPADHPTGFVNSDEYYRECLGGDPMVDNQPENTGGDEVEMIEEVDATPAGENAGPAPVVGSASAADFVAPAPDPIPVPTPVPIPAQPAPAAAAAAAHLPPSGVNEGAIIARFLRGAGLGASAASGDVTAIADSLAQRLGGMPPQDEGDG
ncbi:hypothetical protein FGB62_50g12 [Gracilaria domingensis]|nr:hypothetical protein FGB62_50g12 [Gracilaria domingensis]